MLIALIKTLLIEHPLERWDKRYDISPRENATLPNRFSKAETLEFSLVLVTTPPTRRSANLSWCAEKINKNCKTKPSAPGGVWLFSWLVWSFQKSILVSDPSKSSSGTAEERQAVAAGEVVLTESWGVSGFPWGARIPACYLMFHV